MGIYFRDGPRGRIWYIRFQANGRRRREAAGPSRRLALDLLAKRRMEAAEGKVIPRGRVRACAWLDLARAWMRDAESRKRSWTRDRASIGHLGTWFKHMDPRALTGGDVDGYVAKRLRQRTRYGRPPSRACINRELSCLKSILRRAHEDGLLHTVPRIRLLREPPGRVPRLSAEQERGLVAACGFQRLRVLVLLAIETGCRLSELTGLRWRDLDLDAALLRVEQSKSGDRRDVPLTDAAVAVLRAWKPDGMTPDRFVVGTRSGRRWLAAQRPWWDAVEAAHLGGWRLHDLRHVCASRMVERGVDLYTVASVLGHKSLAMVQRYAHLRPEHRAAAVRGTSTATSRGVDDENTSKRP